MIYFQAENISKSFGDKVLYDGLSFSITQGDKIALIAGNGAGKTTLMNIIAGIEPSDSGVCTYKNELRIAYLRQEPVFEPGTTVSEALLHSGSEINSLIAEYHDFMNDGQIDTPGGQKKLQYLVERMDSSHAWDYEQRVRQVVTLLNIGDFHDKVEQLSGGQQKRIELARILLEDADLVLLDEPTNHLDLDMIEWMEDNLSRKKTTLLIVTHDRYFLDAVCNGIFELDHGKLYQHKGNYTYFLGKKQERLETMKASSDRAVNLLRKETEWMRRTPMARTTKSKARIDAYFDLQEKAGLQRESAMDQISMQMSRLGKKILELEHISKQFGGIGYIGDFSYVFKRGDRIGIAGPNGCGKTTLLNIITGKLQPDKGTVVTGETIRFGYYRQEGLRVDESKRVLDVVTDIAESIDMDGRRRLSASQLLHHFNFNHAMQYDWVYKLSGGEKRRLYLLTILMKNPNFLILDEPTNDFDIETLNILEAFLANYNGCLLVVTHDRYFLDNLVEQLFVFEGNGKIRGYVGNYSAYRAGLKKAAMKLPQTRVSSERPDRVQAREKVKLSYKEQKEYETLEKEIEALEAEKETLLNDLNRAGMSAEELIQVSERYRQVEADLEIKGDRWLELSEWV